MVVVDELKVQRDAWGFLAAVFNTLPDASLVQGLRATLPNAAADDSDSGQAAASSPAAAWMEGLSDAQALEALGKDRARLFRHVDEFCIDPPYESIYVGKSENAVLQELHRFFLEAGFTTTGLCKEPIDYLGMELAFLAESCERELAAAQAEQPEEAARLAGLREEFLADHVQPWVPAYARQMQAAAETGFYREVATQLLAILG